MQHLFQSTFLQALGYAIANSLWQTALVWLLYTGITGLTAVSAAAKYRLAVIAQVTGFTWFIITFQFYYTQYSNASALQHTVSQDLQNIVSSNTDLSSRLINWMVKAEQLLPYVSMAYLLLMLVLCVRWFSGYRQTQRIRNTGLQKMPVEWRLFVNRIAGQLTIKKKIQVFLSDTISSPLTIGFLKPVILIPVASINHLSTDQLEAVLLHELAHIKRYDYLVNILLSVVEISLFFNPFTQLLSKNIRKERENSCDDWVLQFQYDASLYAEALLRIAYLQCTPAFAMAATGKKNELLVRVKRMIEKKENRFSYRKQLLAFFIVTGILSSVAWLNPINRYSEHQPTVTGIKKILPKQPYTIEPMAVSVDNPLFNPVFFLSEPLKAKMKKDIASAQKEIQEAALDYPEEAMHSIESITPMVTGALDQVSQFLSPQNAEWERNIAKMDAAGAELGKKLSSDTGFIGPKIKRRINDDIGTAMKKMETEMKNAKTDMQRSFKMNADIAFDKEKVQLDILKAMESLQQLNASGLDKLMQDALKIVLPPLDENNKSKQRTQQPSVPHENSKPEIRIPAPARAVAARQIVLSEDEVADVAIEDDTKLQQPALVIQLPRLIELAKLKLDPATLLKIKNYLLLKAAVEDKKLKITSLVNKEKVADDEQRVVIQFQ